MRDQYKVLAEKYDAMYENRIGNTMTSATKEVPMRIDSNGAKIYKTKDGIRVVRPNGTKEWWVNDRLHRLDGPAAEWADGYKEWWVNGEEMTEKEFNIEIQRRNILKKASDETGIEMDI